MGYADGTRVDEELMIPLSEGFGDGEETYELLLPFGKVVDPDQVDTILMGEDVIQL